MPGEGDDDFDLDLGDDFDEPEAGQAGAGGDEDLDDAGQRPRDDGDGFDQGAVPGDGPGGAEGEQPRQVRSRAAARIEALDRERREAAQRAEAAERRLQELLASQQSQSRAQTEAQERQRLEQMLPDERAEYIARQTADRTTRELAALRQEMADPSDRATFQAAQARDPRLAKVAAEVESTLAGLRAQGTTLPRTELAAYLLGKKILEKGAAAGTRQRSQAATRVARETARPVSGGGAAAPGRAASKDERAARLARLSADDAFI